MKRLLFLHWLCLVFRLSYAFTSLVGTQRHDKLFLSTEGLEPTERLPTSVEDQVRQCVSALRESKDKRHNLRLLLPIIGATDLDDWPGGARQMMQAAEPLVQGILQGLSCSTTNIVCLDQSDGIYAYLGQAEDAKDDCAIVVLPSAECLDNKVRHELEKQVGESRNLIIVNPQWKRRSDFGGGWGLLRPAEDLIAYAESFVPSFSLTNLICEGESVRVLHIAGNNEWRVYLRVENDSNEVDWALIGSKPFLSEKPKNWLELPGNTRDGGRLFDFGQPSYDEINEMIKTSTDFAPKNPAERAAAAFTFIKDTL